MMTTPAEEAVGQRPPAEGSSTLVADVQAASGGVRLGSDPALFWRAWIGFHYGLPAEEMA
jgi:hypothetical protein